MERFCSFYKEVVGKTRVSFEGILNELRGYKAKGNNDRYKLWRTSKGHGSISKFHIPRRPWEERLLSMIARLMRVNFSAKIKTNKGKLRLSHSKMIEIMKIVRFQSFNYTSKLKGYLFQTAKLREELVVLSCTCLCRGDFQSCTRNGKRSSFTNVHFWTSMQIIGCKMNICRFCSLCFFLQFLKFV